MSGNRSDMSSEKSTVEPDYPYETHLNVLHSALEVIDVPALVAAVTHPWYNQTLCRVDESVVRLGVVKGEYHWHKHEKEDEFFYVVSGHFLIDLPDRTIDLLFRFLRQNAGRLSRRAREGEFAQMADGEVAVWQEREVRGELVFEAPWTKQTHLTARNSRRSNSTELLPYCG